MGLGFGLRRGWGVSPNPNPSPNQAELAVDANLGGLAGRVYEAGASGAPVESVASRERTWLGLG